MRRILSSVSLLALGLSTQPAMAQEYYDLGTLILSGGLTPIEQANLGRAVTVVTGDEIEERGLTTVQEALRALPGVAVNGSGDSFTQVRIRGGEANHTLILIDGIEAAGGDGEYILSGLETAMIERIEVLRGPQSVVYGSNASAGVINIVTRRATPGLTRDIQIETGAAHRASGFFGWRGTRGGVSLALSHLDDQGYDNSGDGGERDGIRRSTAILSADYTLSDTLVLDVTLRRSREHYDFDSTNWAATDADGYVVDDPTQYSDRDEMTAGLGLTYTTLGGRLTHRVSLATTQNSQANNGAAPTDTRSDAAHYRLSFGLDGAPVETSAHLLNAMVEWERDSSSSNPLYDRTSTSYALEYRGEIGGWSVQAGARHDDNSVFADARTWTLAAAYDFGGGWRLHGSAGTGVVNPSYFELYANAFGYVGNPNLAPERNRSIDLGLEMPLGDTGTLDVTVFREALTDEITAVSTGPGSFSYINQTGDSLRHGAEISARTQVSDTLSLRAAYTYLQAENPDGSVEIRRPQHELALGASWGFAQGRGRLSADLRHVRGNWDTQFWGANATVELPAYTTVDVAAQYDLSTRMTLVGRVSNLFDAEVMDVWGYAGRGRAAYVGLQARF
ncbi:TonB-dependent receptor plug domain-containing protein [Pararhodobacter zhoushanensis]|uniref:TonB-dependent receptor n=1 Tax=Pararhodobacter zhoushanensis TaxID=2479545 RepID=A0ABT3H289_9RHOB|nr:TonB-dependent receptor [Pararhodobacter zhoushanensis]MCW1933891.1 TonB-dependent receptor [Pararhodobacter zhoushanensis]